MGQYWKFGRMRNPMGPQAVGQCFAPHTIYILYWQQVNKKEARKEEKLITTYNMSLCLCMGK